MQQRMDIWVSKVFQVLVAAVLGFLLLLSVFSSTIVLVQQNLNGDVEVSNVFCMDHSILRIGFILIFGGFLLLVKHYLRRTKRKIQSDDWIIVAYAIFLLAGLFFIMSVRLEPRSDPEKVMNVARQILAGDHSSFVDQEGYMFRYPFQNGLVLLDVALLSVFGQNAYLAFQVLNLLAVLVIAEMLGRISEKGYLSHSIGNAVRIFVLLQPVTFLYMTYLYGTLLSLACILFAIYSAICYTEKGRWRDFLVCCVASSVAVILKSNSMIPMISMLLFLLWTCSAENKLRKIQNIGLVFGILAACVLGRKGINFLTEFLSGAPTPAGMPKVNWIAMGLSGDGTYNGVSVNIFRESGFDTAASIADAWANIKGSLKYFWEHKGYFTKWFLEKNALQWNDPSFGCIQINRLRGDAYWGNRFFQDLLYGQLGNGLWRLLNNIQSVVLFGAFYYWSSRGQKTKKAYILGVADLGGFLFHCFWEAGSQYIMPYYLMLLPYAVEGWHRIVSRYKGW